jgi:predicted nucleic acid-binding protein
MPVLFDSSVYIEALRAGSDAPLLMQRWAGDSPIWLSSVVLEELYAGAGPGIVPLLEKLERDFEGVKRVLTPTPKDWVRTGRILAQISHKYGYEQVGKSWLTNDTLIATSAARHGITVMTANGRDFARLAEFCSLQWEAISLLPKPGT